jgi:hypothetical protein
MSGAAWTRRQRLLGVFVVAHLALQIGLPTARLLEDRPARFGWHMFSGVHLSPTFSVALPDGSLRAVAAEDYYGNPRADLHYEEHLPAHLCRTLPRIRAVRLEYAGGPVELYPCP